VTALFFSIFCQIFLLKIENHSENLHPNPGHDFLTMENLHPNLGQGILTLENQHPNSGTRFPRPWKTNTPILGQGFPDLGKPSPQLWDTISRLREIFNRIQG
jgi:hypothetical protein